MRRGLLLAGGSGRRLAPLTDHTSKHLLPVAGRPMVLYALDTLLRAGAEHIAVVCTPRDRANFHALLGDGSALACRLDLIVQPTPEGIPQGLLLAAEHCRDGVLLGLGDNLFLGPGVDELAQHAWPQHGAVVFTHRVDHPQACGVIERDPQGLVSAIDEKPAAPRSDEAIVGLVGLDDRAVEYAKNLTPSARGELEMVDLLRCYLHAGTLHALPLPNGVRWLDMGTPDDLARAKRWLAHSG